MDESKNFCPTFLSTENGTFFTFLNFLFSCFSIAQIKVKYLFNCNCKSTYWQKLKKSKKVLKRQKHSGSLCIKSPMKNSKLSSFYGYGKSFFKDKSGKEVKRNPPYQYTWPYNCFDMPSLYESSDAILLISPF
mgnify:CR=1 FL=1